MNPRDLGCKCDACPLKDRVPVTPAQVTMPKFKQLALVGGYPGKKEVRENQFMIGGTGYLLDNRILGHLGIQRHLLHETSAMLCNGDGLTPGQTRKAVECCKPRLVRELTAVAPKAILTMGGEASLALLGISSVTKVAGAPTVWRDTPVLPTYHPAMLFRNRMNWLPAVRTHTLRAWLLSKGELPDWDWGPDFVLDRGPAMDDALQDILDDPAPFSVDIETPRGKPDCGPFHKDFIIKCIGFSNLRTTVVVPWHSYRGILGVGDCWGGSTETAALKLLTSPDHIKILQNGLFDRTVCRTHGIKIAPPFFDLLHAHLILAPGTPHDLAFQAAWELHSPRWKEEFRGQDGTKAFDK